MVTGPEKDDELRSFIKEYLSSTPPTLSPVKAMPILLKSFLGRIFNTFNYQHNGKIDLSERMKYIKFEIDEVLKKLKDLSQDIKSKDNRDFVLFVEIVLTPLKRDGRQIKKNLNIKHPHEQIQVMSKYIAWIDRCNQWVEDYNNCDTETFCNVLSNHIIQESRQRVDKDLKIIKDYADQKISKVDLTQERHEELVDEVQELLNPLIKSLKDLCNQPESLKLEGVNAWQVAFNEKRAKIFEEALALVDNIIEAKTPFQASKEEHAHLVDVLKAIVGLESKAQAVIEEARNSSFMSKALLNRIKYLKEQAHKTSVDLRLTQELFDRTQKVQKALSEISDDIIDT